MDDQTEDGVAVGDKEGEMSTNGESPLWQNLLQCEQSVTIYLGETSEQMGTILHWTEGSLIEFEKTSGEPVDVFVNDRLCFRGEVVVVAENFGVRVTEVVDPDDQPA